jgi:hypothetical protein
MGLVVWVVEICCQGVRGRRHTKFPCRRWRTAGRSSEWRTSTTPESAGRNCLFGVKAKFGARTLRWALSIEALRISCTWIPKDVECRAARGRSQAEASSASLPRLPRRFRPRWRLDPARNQAVEAFGAQGRHSGRRGRNGDNCARPRGFDPHDTRSFAASAVLGKGDCAKEQHQLRRHGRLLGSRGGAGAGPRRTSRLGAPADAGHR